MFGGTIVAVPWGLRRGHNCTLVPAGYCCAGTSNCEFRVPQHMWQDPNQWWWWINWIFLFFFAWHLKKDLIPMDRVGLRVLEWVRGGMGNMNNNLGSKKGVPINKVYLYLSHTLVKQIIPVTSIWAEYWTCQSGNEMEDVLQETKGFFYIRWKVLDSEKNVGMHGRTVQKKRVLSLFRAWEDING